jgi:hypothetical protein
VPITLAPFSSLARRLWPPIPAASGPSRLVPGDGHSTSGADSGWLTRVQSPVVGEGFSYWFSPRPPWLPITKFGENRAAFWRRLSRLRPAGPGRPRKPQQRRVAEAFILLSPQLPDNFSTLGCPPPVVNRRRGQAVLSWPPLHYQPLVHPRSQTGNTLMASESQVPARDGFCLRSR